MKKIILSLMLVPAIVALLVACGNDIKPKRPITDQPGVVFIEAGHRDTVNTNISHEQLCAALLANDWEFSYSFFYDDYIIGNRREDLYDSRFRYTFNEDGTAVATDLSYGNKYSYRYTVTARLVTLTSDSKTFKFGVIAMDERHMICDESIAGTYVEGYDPATLTRRMIFLSRKK